MKKPDRYDDYTDTRKASSYLFSAIDLRNNVETNIDDYVFTFRDYGEIRYLFDANAVRFFLNPFKEYERVGLFSKKDLAVLAPLAIVTAEYMFSRKLCGQWGAPGLISAAHASELEEHAHKLVNKLEQYKPDERTEENLRVHVQSAISEVRGGRRIGASIEKLFESDKDIRALITDDAYEAQMFMRIADEDLLEPLQLDHLATRDVLEPDSARIADWESRLDLHRRAQLNARDTETSFANRNYATRNNRNDAVTITQLLMLNEAASQFHRPIRYVLVTFDQAIYNAMIDWCSSDQESDLGFFPVRRILQYVPFLNTDEMPNQVEGTRIITDIKEALDSLLYNISNNEAHYPKLLPTRAKGEMLRGTGPMSESLTPILNSMEERYATDLAFHGNVSHVRMLWSELSRQSVYLNASMLGRRVGAFSSLSDFLENWGSVRVAVVKFMEETVRNVERAHVAFTVRDKLSISLEMLQHRDKDNYATRGLLMLRSRFYEFTEGRDLYDFLNEIIQAEPDRAWPKLLQKICDGRNHTSFLFSGCVAFWAADFETALFFSKRALQMHERQESTNDVGDRSAKLELGYFYSAALRYKAMDLDGSFDERATLLFEVTEKLHDNRELGLKTGDKFAVIRADIELAMTRVTLAWIGVLGKGVVTIDASRQAGQAFDLFSSTFEELDFIKGHCDRQVATQVLAEILTGLSGCVLHHYFFDGDLNSSQIRKCLSLANRLRELQQAWQELVPPVYELAADLLDVMFEQNAVRKRELVDETKEKLGRMAQSKDNTTRLDRLAIGHLLRILDDKSKNWVPV